MNFGYFLRVEQKRFPDGSDVGCEKDRRVKDNSMVSGLGNWVNREVIYKIEKAMRKTCLGYVDTKSSFWASKAVMLIQHVSRDVKQSVDTHT